MYKKLIAGMLALISAAAFAAVDVNNASEADLDSIKGIGPGTTARILEARKSAKFKDWSDLIQRVSGIGEKRAVKLSAEGLTVNNAAFVPSQPAKKGGVKAEKVASPSTTTKP